MSDGFDIQQQASSAQKEDDGTVVHVNGLDDKPMFYTAPDGAERPVTITVAGTLSRRYRRVESEIRKRPIKVKKLTGEVFHEDAVEKAVACTIAWEGFTFDGTPVDATRVNVLRLYQACPWVMEQVTDAMQDHTRFFGSASPQQ
jgi:hypothetical protein